MLPIKLPKLREPMKTQMQQEEQLELVTLIIVFPISIPSPIHIITGY